MITKQKLLFYCQHSVGIGHLVRSFAIIEALKKVFNVTLISGGLFPEGIPMPSDITFVQLPPIGQNSSGKLEVIASSKPLYEVMSERKKILFNTYKKLAPQIVVTEYFPFGKIQFMGELLPVLKHIKTSNESIMLVASLRDILELKSTSQKLQQRFSTSVVNDYYHEIIVHGDPNIIPLETTCPQAKSIETPVSYSGYVTKAQPIKPVDFTQNKTVVLSLGSGKVGNSFALKMVAAYQQFGFGQDILLLIIAGPLFPEEEYEALQQLCKTNSGITIQNQVPNLLPIWENARLSVSMAGYNTSMELIKNKIPAVLLPYENPTNTEQVIRSKKMAEAGLVLTVDFNRATPKELAGLIVKGLHFTPIQIAINLDGAKNTAKLLKQKYKSYAATQYSNT